MIRAMSPEVQVDQHLATVAAQIAASRGERIEDVVERALRAYINPDKTSVPSSEDTD